MRISERAKKGISFAVAAVMVGDAVAEAISCGLLYLSYRADKKKLKKNASQLFTTIGAVADHMLDMYR